MVRRGLAVAISVMCCVLAMHDGSGPPRVRQAFSRPTWPLVFEPNRGQVEPGTQFVARAANYVVRAAHGTATFVRRDDALSVSLVGANPAASAEGVDESPARVNYLIGNTPSKWIVGVPTYNRVRYRGVYEGVDFVLYGAGKEGKEIEYDLIVQPRVDPHAIALKFDGAERIDLDPDGDLVLTLAGTGERVRQRRPHIHQVVDGVRRSIDGGYVLGAGGEVRFWIGPYGPNVQLTIDPVVVYSKAFGGTDRESVSAIAVDGQGNTYVTGRTASIDFPASATALQRTLRAKPSYYGMNAFVAKVDASGSKLVYATYLGGNGARVSFSDNDLYDPEVGYGIAVDAAGNAYVTGVTQSTDFPTVNAFQSQAQGPSYDAFIAKLNPSGSALIYSTYLGGSDGSSKCVAIAVDGLGNAYVAGETFASRFPITARIGPPRGTQRIETFVTKFNQSGGMAYSTGIGVGDDAYASSIAVDAMGQAVIAGHALSAGFPVVNAWLPACSRVSASYSCGFLAKLSASGSQFVYATYVGGDLGNGTATAVALDAAGNAYVTGQTSSAALPTVKPIQAQYAGGIYDTFVASFGPAGAVRYVTYLGGHNNDTGASVAADPAGNVYVAGQTDSTDFPLAQPIFASHPSGPVFRSVDRGAGWKTAASGLHASVNVLRFDPRTPAIMYAATYKGVFKTSNGGQTWALSSNGLPDDQFIHALAIDPDTPSTLYAGGGVIYKTVDAGAHWTRAETRASAYAVAIDAAMPTTVYAGGTFGVWKTSDGGRTWTSSSSGLGSNAVVTDLLIDPASCGAIVYAAASAVYESHDRGASWNQISQGLPDAQDWRLVIDPRDPRTLYATSRASVGGTWRSTDRGRTWTQLLKNGRVLAITPDADRTMYASVSGETSCLRTSADGGDTWTVTGDALNNGGCDVWTVAVDPLCPSTVFGAGGLRGVPYLARLAPDGSLNYSTYLSGVDAPSQVAADGSGNAYLARVTEHAPTIGITKIAPLPSLTNSSRPVSPLDEVPCRQTAPAVALKCQPVPLGRH